MNTKLYVRNLTISFRTNEGKVQAVRGINFELNEGETLAIVGESGSGKSVTSKAILGILSGNSIIEVSEGKRRRSFFQVAVSGWEKQRNGYRMG